MSDTETPSTRFLGTDPVLTIGPDYRRLIELAKLFLAYRGLPAIPIDVLALYSQPSWVCTVMHLNDQKCAGDFFYLLDQLGVQYKG